MSDELSTTEKCVEEVLIDLMAKKLMSTGIQSSSMRGVQSSPSTARGYRPSQATVEKRTKHQDDLVSEVNPNYPTRLHPAFGWCGES
jgi:hypothetical protein